jgi:MFS superfamily sulfate permease-like transporter
MAYASLAGLPPEFGIYCYLLGGLGYAFVGSSRPGEGDSLAD